MTLRTRKPNGRPAWPIILIAGVEKSGKSWACAQASGDQRIGRTIWISVGEDDPEELDLVPGADFEIAEHTGTLISIRDTVREAVAEPSDPEHPTLIVVDSGFRLWELISQIAQHEANQRSAARKNNKPTDEAPITPDLWNKANARWNSILNSLREHTGPVIITGRLDRMMVVDDQGQPVRGPGGVTLKEWKIKSQKSLPYDAGAVIQLRGGSHPPIISGVRSAIWTMKEPEEIPGLTISEVWDRLGINPGSTTAIRHTILSDTQTPAPTADDRNTLERIMGSIDPEEIRQIGNKLWETGRLGIDVTEIITMSPGEEPNMPITIKDVIRERLEHLKTNVDTSPDLKIVS
jgi:hypothetical protein